METITTERLANNLDIVITDQSRLIAADRWYVKIVCEVILPLVDEHFADCAEAEPDLFARIRQRMGHELKMELVQERNFVDAGVREEVGRELLARISGNITSYLAAAPFPARFFAVRYAEAKKACLADLARDIDEPEEEDGGPADFSACFRD